MTFGKRNDKRDLPRSNVGQSRGGNPLKTGNSTCTGPAAGGTWHFELPAGSKRGTGKVIQGEAGQEGRCKSMSALLNILFPVPGPVLGVGEDML